MRSTCLFICSLLLFGAALSARHFIPLESASDSTFTAAPFPAIVASKGNVAVTASTISNSVSLFKRNSAGFYDLQGNVSVPGTPYQISTDGTWISVSILFEYTCFLFQIDDNGQKTNMFEIPSELDAASLIAPNTLAIINSTYIKTYEYNAGKWLLVDESAFGTPGDLYVNIGKEVYRMTENTFAGTYQYQSQFYGFLMQRQADKSWTLFDKYNISTVGDDPSITAWNGNDTVVVTTPGSSVISVHVREGPGQWSQQLIYSWQLGYSIQSQFGHAVLVIDSNNFLISAPYHVYNGDGTSGAALLMHRDSADAEWDFTLEFGRFSFREVQFGFGLASNDHDLLVYSCRIPPEGSNVYNCTFFTHPSCFLDPIDVTCASPAELAQCNSLAVADVYTLNNPQCGHVSHSVPEFNWSDEGVQFNVTFTRALVPEVTCAISMMCPAAPVANNIPLTAPSPTTTVPVTSSTPIAVPAAKVSAGASVVNTIALYFAICNAFLTLLLEACQ